MSEVEGNDSPLPESYFEFQKYKPLVYAIVQLGCLVWMRPKKAEHFKRLLLVIPFYIQLLWSLAGICYNLYYFSDPQWLAGSYLNMCFDALAKCLLAYYVGVRLMIISRVENTTFEYYFCLLSVCLSSLAGNIVTAMAMASEDEDFIYLSTAVYVYIDLFSLAIELFICVRFIQFKCAEAKTFSGLIEKLRQLDLVSSVVTLIVMGLCAIPISLMYILEDWLLLDCDFNFYNLYAAFRYALSCHMARRITERVLNAVKYINAKSPKDTLANSISTQTQSNKIKKTSNGLSDFANVSRLE